MKKIFKYISLFLLSFTCFGISNISVNNETRGQNTLDETPFVEPRKAQENHEFALTTYYDDKHLDVTSGQSFVLLVRANPTNVSSLQFEIRFDSAYLELTNVNNNIPINESRGDIFDINFAKKGICSVSLSSLYNLQLHGNLLELIFFVPFSITNDASSYIDIIIDKALNMDDVNVNIRSRGIYINVSKSSNPPPVSERFAYHIFSPDYYTLKNDELVTFCVSFHQGDPYSSYSYRITYDPNQLRYVSSRFDIYGTIGDANDSEPGVLNVKGSNTTDFISNYTEIFYVTFKAINKCEQSTDVKIEYLDLINSKFEKVGGAYETKTITLQYSRGKISKLSAICTENDYTKGLIVDIYLEIDQLLGAIDVYFSSKQIFEKYTFDKCIAGKYEGASIGVNTNYVQSESKIKISLLSGNGVMGKINLCTIYFKPVLGDNVDYINYDITFKEAVTPDFIGIPFDSVYGDLYVEHFHNFKMTIVKQPTCTESGVQHGVCACGVEGEFPIPPTGHTYGSWETVKKESNFSSGTYKRKCSVCGEYETKEVPPSLPDYLLNECERFAQNFMDINICGLDDNTPADMNKFLTTADYFASISEYAKNAFRDEDANYGDSIIYKCLQKYDRIMFLYGDNDVDFPNYMNRNIIRYNEHTNLVKAGDQNIAHIIVISTISLLTFITIPMFILIKKKNIVKKQSK